MMSDIDSVLKRIVLECREDYVGLWSVIREVRSALGGRSSVVEGTLSLIRRLLVEGDVVAGQFHRNEFHEWGMPVEDIIAKIEREWAQLGHEPTGGDVVWFTASEARK